MQKKDAIELWVELQACRSMKEAEVLVFQLVKEDRVSPSMMGDLIVDAYKRFIY